MSSLNKEISELSDTHVSIYTSTSTINLSFYSSTFHLYRGNLIMSPTWQKSLVLKSASQKMPWFISVLCSLFKDLYLYLIIPIPIIIISENSLCLPSCIHFPSHSCDLLKDSLPSSSHHSFSSTSPEYEDLEFWRWYLRIHYHYWWTHLLQLSASLIYWHPIEFLPCSTSTHLFTW